MKTDQHQKSVIIIGAGMAGLAAGCYARMNGYRTRLFELHDKPGGLCTAWKRGGYTFDGCIHWLVGSSPALGFHRIWRELGAVRHRRFIEHEYYTVIESGDGRALTVYTNADRLAAHLAELSPADKPLADELGAAIKKFTRMNMSFEKPSLWRSLGAGVAMMSLAPLLSQYASITIEELGRRFQDPFLRDAIGNFFGYPDFPAHALLLMLAYMHAKSAGFPEGGSLEFIRAIERRLLALGGEITYRVRVKKIIVENDTARGVELENGEKHYADHVISAADGHATIFDLLDGRYASAEVRGYYDTLPVFRPVIQVSLGVNRDLSGTPSSVVWPLSSPVEIAGERRSAMGFRHFCYDPTMAPAGKSSLEVLFYSDYDYWKQLKNSGDAAYQAEKKKILETVLSELEKRLPGIKDRVEVSDVSTPLTYERYTGNWQGSMEGWRVNKATLRFMMNGMDSTLPGLKNFHMIGQWVKPGGGLPPAALSGREVAAALCRKDRRKFTTTTAD